jgi:hypothetical protein
MVGTIIGSVFGTAAAAAVAASVALAGHTLGSSPVPGTVSPFGGSVPVRIAHVGHIEVDLSPAGNARLDRVPCAGTRDAGTACYVSTP